MADFNIVIGFDDTEVFKGLGRTADALEDVEKEAKDLDRTIDKTTKNTANNFKRVEKSVDDAGKAFDRTSRRAKGLSGQLRGFSRDISLIRNVALGGLFTSAAQGVEQFAQGLETTISFLSPTVALNNRIAKSLGEVAVKFVEEKSALDSLAFSARADNENKEEAQAARQALIEQYGPYLNEVQREQILLGNVAEAQKAATTALINNLAAQAKRQELNRIIEEFAQTESRRAVQQAEAESTIGQIADFASGLFGNVVGFVSAGQVEIDTRLSQVNEAITDAQQDNLVKQAQNIQEVEDRTKEFLTTLEKELQDSFGATADGQNQAAQQLIAQRRQQAERLAKEEQRNREKLIQQELKDAQRRRDIIARLESEAINTRLDAREDGLEKELALEKRRSEERIRILGDQEKDFVRQIEERQAKINEVFGEGSKQAVDFAKSSSEELKQIRTATNNAIEAQLELTGRKQANIRKKFRDQETAEAEKAREKELSDALDTTNQKIALAQAELREQQALELAGLNLEEASEEERTRLLERQARERERLTLVSEQKRLETVLKFSQGRTEAEIAATRALLAAVNQELQNFDEGRDRAIEPKEGQNILAALGFDDKEQAAIQQGVGQAVAGIEDLVNKQVEFTNAAVEAKNAQIAELRTQLQEELALNEAGFASNVEGVKQQLEEEQKAREIALEKQRKAQQAQVALQTIQQSVNLITASTQIFSSLAGAGPVGIGIAIATIAAMFAAFVGAKAKAASLTKLEKGGKLKGPSHAQGGIGITMGGHKTDYEAEGGEWVVRKDVSAEHDNFIDRMNRGEFRGIDLEAMVDGAQRISKLQKTANIANTVQARKQEQLYTYAIVSAIMGQTDSLLKKGFNKLLERPQTTFLDDKTIVEVHHKPNGGRVTKKINLK